MTDKATEFAWAAGIFEGEGYVGIYRTPGKPAERSRRHSLRCGVTNTDMALLTPFQETWGGKINEQSRNRPSNFKKTRPCYIWHVFSLQAVQFLRDIYPYMKGVKKRKAAIALEFQARMSVAGRVRDSNSRITSLTEEEIQCRESLMFQLRAVA